MARESKLEKDFKEELKHRLPGSYFIKGNSAMRQGFPDRMVLHGSRWAALEFKADEKSDFQPNQEHYLEELGKMSFAAVVTPANYQKVIDEMESAFGVEG